MKFLISFTVCALFSTLAFAALPPSFDSAKWDKLVTHITQDGAVMQTQAGIFMVISQVIPADQSQPHLANYISTVGGYDVNGDYQISHIESVWENWTKDNAGNWDIEQWIYIVSPKGDLSSAQNNHILESADGILQKYEYRPSTDAQNLQHWDAELTGWYSSITQ